MALIKCKECKAEVSNKAKTCPSCGVKNPGITFIHQMGGLALLAVIIGIAMNSCSGSDESTSATNMPEKTVSAPAPVKWYEGGTLHQRSGLDWQSGTYEDKLATCADILATLWTNGKLKTELSDKIKNVNDLKPLAEQLVTELDAAFEPEADAEKNKQMFTNQTVSTTAGLVMIMSGWIK